jgi:hypothetical protein
MRSKSIRKKKRPAIQKKGPFFDKGAKEPFFGGLQRAEAGKKEEDKPVQKADKKEEDKPVQKADKKEEEKPVQKADKKEEEKPVQKADKKEEEKPVQKKVLPPSASNMDSASGKS